MRYMPAHAVSSHDQRYAYASGRIRALEMTLLGKQRLDRLAEAGNSGEAARKIFRREFTGTFNGTRLTYTATARETFLKNEERRLLDLVDALSLDRNVSDILRLVHDFHNLKVALREKVAGRDLADLYTDLGRFDAAGIGAALKADAVHTLPEILVDAAGAALEAYGASQDPAVADLIVDKAMFAHSLKVAGSYGGAFLRTLVRTWVDLANIRSFFRARYLGLEARILPDILIEGGLVKLADFLETYQFTVDEIVDRFEFSPYRRVMDIGGSAGEKEGSFVPLEREIDNAILAAIRITRYFTFGLEVVIAYALMKQIEIRALRLLLAGKERGMASDAIKERIPDAE